MTKYTGNPPIKKVKWKVMRRQSNASYNSIEKKIHIYLTYETKYLV